ncbi:MAG: helix-turn-helix domain-containing protein [Desulfobulbaceae bacterium]|nr:helix-turn-helix domain-containing protein [Desulfobulbaceae bacterium]
MFIIVNMDLFNDMEVLGEQIREARKQRGLLQSDIARLVPVRRQVISELERGVYKGSLQRAMEVLRAMGLRLTVEPVRFPTLDELSDE